MPAAAGTRDVAWCQSARRDSTVPSMKAPAIGLGASLPAMKIDVSEA